MATSREAEESADRALLARLNYKLLVDCPKQTTGDATLDSFTQGGPVIGQVLRFRSLQIGINTSKPTKTDGAGKALGPWQCDVTGGPISEAVFASYNKLSVAQQQAIEEFVGTSPYVPNARVLDLDYMLPGGV